MAELILATANPELYISNHFSAMASARLDRNFVHKVDLINELAVRGHEACQSFLRDNWKRFLMRGNAKRDRELEVAEYYILLDRLPAYITVMDWLRENTRHKPGSRRGLCLLHPDKYQCKWWRQAAKWRQKQLLRDRTFAMRAEFPEVEDQLHGFSQGQESSAGTDIENVRSRTLPDPDSATEKQKSEMRMLLTPDLSDQEAVRVLGWLQHAQVSVQLDQVRAYIERVDLQIEEDTPETALRLRLKRRALEALQNTTGPEIRNLMLEYIGDPAFSSEALGLLKSNFHEGDEEFVREVIMGARHYDELHFLGMEVLDLEKRIPGTWWNPILLHLFDRHQCTACRNRVFESLIRRRLVTVDMAHALVYDADEGTRRLARKWLQRRK